jgi:hypothetical protein
MFKTKPKVTAAEIHAEVEKHGAELLAEVQKVLQTTDRVITDKPAVLKELGFVNVPTKKEDAISPVVLARIPEVIESVERIRAQFPGRVFLTNSQFLAVCNKYGLVDKPVMFFKGVIPDKNLREIEMFKRHTRTSLSYSAIRVNGISWYSDSNRKEYGPAVLAYLESHDFIVPGLTKEEVASTLMRKVHGRSNPDTLKLTNGYKETTMLRIAGPSNQFTETNPFNALNPFKQDIHDPIVTYPYGPGRIVITAWGPEAEDELLQLK